MRTLVLAGVLALSLGVLACGKSKDAAGSAGPKEVASLPARPSVNAKAMAEKFPDGAFSVEGFLKHAHENSDKEVTVRGYVLQADLCKPDVPCSIVPSVTLVDDLNNARRRLVVVGTDRAQDLSALAAKSAQTLVGKVAMWSPDGRMINMDGILVLNPPAPTPEEAAKAAEAAKAEKKTAKSR